MVSGSSQGKFFNGMIINLELIYSELQVNVMWYQSIQNLGLIQNSTLLVLE